MCFISFLISYLDQLLTKIRSYLSESEKNPVWSSIEFWFLFQLSFVFYFNETVTSEVNALGEKYDEW